MVGLLLIPIAIAIFTATPAHADEILNVAAFTELYQCYVNDGEINASIKDLKGTSHYLSKYVKEPATAASRQTVILPNSYQHTIQDNTLNCWQLITGYSSGKQKWTGIISNGKTSYSQTDMIAFLPKVGYTPPQASGGGGTPCVRFIYDYVKHDPTPILGGESKGTHYTDQFCISDVDTDNKITNNSKITINNGEAPYPDLTAKDSKRSIKVDGAKEKIPLTNGETVEVYAKKVYDSIRSVRASYTHTLPCAASTPDMPCFAPSYDYTLKMFSPEDNIEGGAETGDGDKINGEWKIDSMETAANTAISNYSSFSGIDDVKFTADQKGSLHKYYFTTFFGGKLVCEGDSEYENLPGTAVKAENVTSKTCFAVSSQNSGATVHGARATSDPEKWEWYQDYTFAQLVAAMTEDELTGASSYTPPEGETDPATSAERKPDCHTKAGALGFILCPTIEASSNAVEMVYTDLVEPYLQIDAVLFDTTSQGGAEVRNIWSLFQGFANLAFVIVFLFVIFSQLTGIGIDNYGIKKILPKLIIGAVLINLSYIICQLAVDISNILGRAVASMFENFGSNLDSTVSQISVNLNPREAAPVTGKFPSGTKIIVGIASILGVSGFLAGGFAIIIPALVSLVTLVVGIMFLFILLALRQAVAVILVVVSPLAFAAYMLPNTKKLFDKWLDAFKGMLIAYPVCSALVYGGDFVSKILLVSEGSQDLTSLGIILSAAAVAVAPIFFIPSVIKKGMNSVAGLGNMLNKMQGNISGKAAQGANSRLQHSRLTDYQNRRQQEMSNRASARRAEKNAKVAKRRLNGGRISRGLAALTGGAIGGGLQGKVNRKGVGKLSIQDRAAYQDANSTINAQDKQMTDLYDQTFSTMGVSELQDQLELMGKSGKMDTNMAVAAINRIAQMDQKQAIIAMDKLSSSKAFKSMGDKDRNRIIQTCLSQKGNPLLKAYGKQLGVNGATKTNLEDKNLSFSNFAADNGASGMGGRLRDMGNSVFADMDKDVMEYIAGSKGMADMFDNAQMAAAYAQGFSGATGTQFGKVIQARSEANVVNDLGSMKTQQVANINGDTIKHLVDKVGSQAAVRTALSGQIAELNKEDNAEMRAGMSQSTRSFLGIFT